MKKNSLFTIIIILVLLGSDLWAQSKQLVITSEMQYQYAVSLFEEKDYETAMVEFKRFIHFFPDSEHMDQVKFNTGVCLYHLEKYHEAARMFNGIILKDKTNDITGESYFYQTRAFIKMGNTGYAQIVLQNYLMLAEDEETRDRIYFNLAQIHLEKAKNPLDKDSLTLAKKNLSMMSDSGSLKYNRDYYSKLIFKARHAPTKSPTAAGVFALIPGGGFLYCERFYDAFVTFCLNAGLMYASYSAWDHDNKALAGVVGFVEVGFYTGNIYGSVSSAHKYNQAQKLKILNKEFTIASGFDLENEGYALLLNYGF